jgi:hypothetical protein
MGIMVLAEAKNVATKSMIMVDRMMDFEKIKRMPSPAAFRLMPGALSVSCCTGPMTMR